VFSAVDFAVGRLTIGDLRQAPGATGPLVLTLTGFKGGVGTYANLFIEAPNGLVIPRLSETDASIVTTAASVQIENAYIGHELLLKTPFLSVLDNDLSPRPVFGNDLQLFQPTGAFFLSLDFYGASTDAYVVDYDSKPQLGAALNGGWYLGPSFVRDFDRQGIPGDVGPVYMWDRVRSLTETIFPVDVFELQLENQRRKQNQSGANGPAVNLGNIKVFARRSLTGYGLTVVRD